jgi:hypothetical protein
MTIHVRCPNAECGKLLAVRDDFAGKTGKCPSCGATMPIPAADESPPVLAAAVEDEAPPEHEPRPAARRRRRRQEEEDEDDYDDYDDDRPRGRGRFQREDRRRPRDPQLATLLCLGIGIGLLLFLAFTPLFSFATKSGLGVGIGASESVPSLFTGDPNFIGTWPGKVIMFATLAVAVLVVVSLVVCLTASPEVGDLMVTIGSCVAGGWGVTALLWQLGLIWKVFSLAKKINEIIGNRDISVSPGIGLWIGMGLALATVAVFSCLMSLRQKTLWIYLGEGVGLGLGLLVGLVVVQPWKTPLDQPGEPRPSFLRHTTPGLAKPFQ